MEGEEGAAWFQASGDGTLAVDKGRGISFVRTRDDRTLSSCDTWERLEAFEVVEDEEEETVPAAIGGKRGGPSWALKLLERPDWGTDTRLGVLVKA